jgi:HNH endonuclease/Domain of unknown function (DUF4351)
LDDDDAYFSHEPDHIIAEKHGGVTTLENLAWACFDCNRFKGSDIATRDLLTGNLVPLFNPRTQLWHEHFAIHEGTICPLTAVGRATALLLKLNLPKRVEVRQVLALLKRKGKQEALILLLEKKFGKLSTALRRKVRQIESTERLESLLLAVLDADSLEDLPL